MSRTVGLQSLIPIPSHRIIWSSHRLPTFLLNFPDRPGTTITHISSLITEMDSGMFSRANPCPGAISAKITGGGTYALMALKAESTILPTGAPTRTTGLAPAAAQTGIPRIASVALAPAETAKPAPVSPAPLIGAVLAGILIYKRYRT